MMPNAMSIRLQSRTPGVHTSTAVMPGSQRWLLYGGMLGSVLFSGVYLIAGTLRPGYDPVRESISALGVGPHGWVQSANFILFGLFSAGVTVALRRALAPGRGALAVPLLRALAALGLLLDGAFAAGPGHQLGDALTFTAVPLACLVLARRLSGEPGWRGWATYTRASAVAFWALLAAFALTNAHGGAPAGLLEKLAATVMAIWLFLLAARLLSTGGRVTAPHPTP